MDVASLQVRVSTQGVEAAQRELDKLGKNASNAEKSVGGLSSSMKTLGALASVGAMATLAKEAIKMADSYKLIEARLSLVTKGTLELANAQQSLFNISQNTRQSFKETADLYASLARSTQQLGKTQTETLRVTETINKAIIISGASAQSAQAALVQLGQGFASGTLRGEELNSILEQTPRIAEAIAKGMGVTIGQLRALGAEGSLTGEAVFEALQKQAKAVDEEFAKIPPTVGQATIQIGNSLTLLAGTLDKATGATDALARSFSDLSKTISDTALSMDVANKSVFSLKTADEFDKKTKLITDEINELRKALETDDGFLWFGLDERTTGEYQNRIKRLEQQLKQLGDTRDDVAKSLAPSLDDAMRAFQNSEKAYRSTFNPSKEEIEAEKKATRERISQAEKLAEDWSKRNIEITTNMAIAQQDELAKPFIVLEAKYKEDLETFKGVKGAKERLTLEYNAEVERQLKDLTEKFNKEEEAKAKKSAEWQVKMLEANEKYNDEIIKMQDEMYGTDTTVDAWYNNQLEYLGKLSQEAGATAEELQTLLDKIETLKAMKLQKQTISFKVEQSFYNSFEDNLADSIEDAFNGTLNFKKFFKNIGNDLMKTFSSSLAGVGTNMLRGNYSALAALGGASASLVGTSISAEDISGIMNSGGTFDSATNTITTSGGTKIGLNESGGGSVASTGSDIMSLVNTVGTLKTAYTLATAGLSTTIMNGFSGLSNLTGISGISQFGYGFTNPFAAANPMAGLYGSGVPQLSGLSSIGSTAGGLALGGGIGYGVGTLGDKLFGADTKAGIYGAIGGAIGSLGGPIGIAIGSALGSVIGGLFGKKKVTDVGYQFFDNVTALDEITTDTVKQYSDWKKKSWFSSKSGTDYSNLSSKELKQIEYVFDTYDYLLTQLGDTDKIWLNAGKYTGASFGDALSKNFISAFTDVNQNNDATFYQAWVDYAESVDKTVIEALTESVNTFIQSKRTFEFWSLGDSVEALAKKAEWAKSDLENLEGMVGVTGITVDNFLEQYNKAVKENFTPETITQWDNLSSALMNATDAEKAYQAALDAAGVTAKQLADTITKSLSEVRNLINQFELRNDATGLSNLNIETMRGSVDELAKQLGIDLATITADNLEDTYNNKVSSFGDDITTDELNLLNSFTTGFINLVTAMEQAEKSTSDLRNSLLLTSGQTVRNFEMWRIGNSATSVQSNAEYLANELQMIQDVIGVTGVTVDNFLQKQREALQESLDANTVSLWQQLGQALISATDAGVAYNQLLVDNADRQYAISMSIQNTKDDFEIWAAGSNSDPLVGFNTQLDIANRKFTELSNSLGVTGVTVDNFLDMMELSIGDTTDEIQVNKWNVLGNALKSITEITISQTNYLKEQRAEADALAQQIRDENIAKAKEIEDLNNSIYAAIMSAIDAISPSVKKLSDVIMTSKEAYSEYISAVEAARSSEIKLANEASTVRIEALKRELEYSTNMQEIADDLSEMLLGSSKIFGTYTDELEQIKKDFVEGKELDFSELSTAISSYVDGLKETSTSTSEYLFGIARARNEIQDIALQSDAELITSAITQEENTLATLLKSIDTTAISMLQAFLSNNQVSSTSVASNNPSYSGSSTELTRDQVERIAYSYSQGGSSRAASIFTDSTGYTDYLRQVNPSSLIDYNSDQFTKSVSALMAIGDTDITPADVMDMMLKLGYKDKVAFEFLTASLNDSFYDNYKKAMEQFAASYANTGIHNPLSFATGSSNIPYDMPANIHRGEIIVPSTFSDGLRRGDLTMGNNRGIIDELRGLREESKQMKQLMVKLVSDNTKQLSTQRAILGERVAI